MSKNKKVASSKKNSKKHKKRGNERKSRKKYVEKVYILKKPFYKKWWFWLICFMLLSIIMGQLSENQEKVNNKNSDSGAVSKNTTSQENESQKNRVISYGDEGDSEGLTLKIIDKEERTAIDTMGGYSIYKPEDGGKFALINITLKNNANRSKGTNNSYFKLVKGDVTYAPSTLIITGTNERFFTFESLNPGLSASGYIVFEVPQDFSFEEAQIRFDGTGLFNDPLVFELN